MNPQDTKGTKDFISAELGKAPHHISGPDPASYISAAPSLRPVFCTGGTITNSYGAVKVVIACLTTKWPYIVGFEN